MSGWAALELVAPFATTTPNLHIYVAEDDVAGTLSRAIDTGVPVASRPRIYADLASFAARGLDAKRTSAAMARVLRAPYDFGGVMPLH